jgi:hypothetical protein
VAAEAASIAVVSGASEPKLSPLSGANAGTFFSVAAEDAADAGRAVELS